VPWYGDLREYISSLSTHLSRSNSHPYLLPSRKRLDHSSYKKYFLILYISSIFYANIRDIFLLKILNKLTSYDYKEELTVAR
jgi:hypothetical protein